MFQPAASLHMVNFKLVILTTYPLCLAFPPSHGHCFKYVRTVYLLDHSVAINFEFKPTMSRVYPIPFAVHYFFQFI